LIFLDPLVDRGLCIERRDATEQPLLLWAGNEIDRVRVRWDDTGRGHRLLQGEPGARAVSRKEIFTQGRDGGTRAMPDDKSDPSPADPSRVGLKEEHERDYWMKKFRVSIQTLAEAVRAVGPSAEKVEEYLKGK
jgi:Protein of unknown function (DUF3606)